MNVSLCQARARSLKGGPLEEDSLEKNRRNYMRGPPCPFPGLLNSNAGSSNNSSYLKLGTQGSADQGSSNKGNGSVASNGEPQEYSRNTIGTQLP